MQCRETMAAIYQAKQTFYWADDWSPEFYIALARAGFISVSLDGGSENIGQLLLPEMQDAYAVLDWENLHMSRSMKRWMRSDDFSELDLQLVLGCSLSLVLDGIVRSHGEENWLYGKYERLLREIAQRDWENFELVSVGLKRPDGTLAGGEIGYRVGRVYTSLTGFFDRSDSRLKHAGKLQLCLLAEYLRNRRMAFWNLGHPYMQYKKDLGAKILPRGEFLRRWIPAVKDNFPEKK